MVTKTVISYRIQAKQSLGCVQCCRSRTGSGFFKGRDPDKKRSGSATLNWFDTLKWDWGTNLTSPQSWMVRRSIEGGEGERG